MLHEGDGIPMNKSLAAHYFKLSADQGDPTSQFKYGVMLHEGDGIPMNKSLAAHYFKLSADQGDAAAQFYYGILLLKGDGIRMNKSLAADYYRLSADQGHAVAQFGYGVMLAKGDGIAMNKSLAADYFKLSADQGVATAQFNYGIMLWKGDGIPMNKSLAADYFKLSADQGHAAAQFNYGVMLAQGDGIPMNKSLAADYYKLSADQGDAEAQFNYGVALENGDGIAMNKSLAAHYYQLSANQGFCHGQLIYGKCLLNGIYVKKNEYLGVEFLRRAADQGLISAQLYLGTLLRDGHVIERNVNLSAYYFKLAADQGSIEGQLQYAAFILRDDGVSGRVERDESERYLRMAVAQGDSMAQMRLGIALLSGLYGRFDFLEARHLFEIVSKSTSQPSLSRLAIVLRDSLSMSNYTLMSISDFFATGSVFSFLRSSIEESIPLIRILNPHLCDLAESSDQPFQAWQNLAHFAMDYLVSLSQAESTPVSTQSDQDLIFGSLATDLLSCNTISEMIPVIFKMYSINCSLYKNLNHFLRSFPVVLVGQFMKELGGLLRYIYLLQSSIEYCSHIQPLSSDMIVYRGIQQHGRMLAPLYESMIGEVIIWRGFTSTSTNRDFVLSRFIEGEDSMLFEILLHPGDVATSICDYCEHEDESDILIAASSGFMVDEVEEISIDCQKKIPQVKLSYCMSWYDFNIDDPPAPVLV
jgi:TPR repeat protein